MDSESIGIIGLGKLGLPVAVTLARKCKVYGYDKDPAKSCLRKYEHRELGPNKDHDFQKCFDDVVSKEKLSFCSDMKEVVDKCDIIFVAVQTPHEEGLDGSTSLCKEFQDFDYSYLIDVANQLSSMVTGFHTVAIISTVLPGTIRKRIVPILGDKCKVVYNPFFIAMGTVMYDLLNPEFVLLGSYPGKEGSISLFWYWFYSVVRDPAASKPAILTMSYESAELTKMAYNTFITQKICFSNVLMQIAHKVPGCNVDDVTNALSKATDRLISPKYLSGGMGDGGPCHIRDNIAMSYLANELRVHDIFDDLIGVRECQADWLAREILKEEIRTSLPIMILGKAFKPETNITTGSSALLLAYYLGSYARKFKQFDPYIDGPLELEEPKIFFIATKHKVFSEYNFPKGSVVIDPFRYIPKINGVEVISLGVGK